jgi:hypothetical protein
MNEDKKTLGNVQKGESLKRIADALEHIAYYLAIIVNKNTI